MWKKLLIAGFIFVLLLGIPLAVYLLTQQTKVATHAAPSTTLSFSTLNGPVTVGQPFSIDIIMDPGKNQVSFAKLILTYDASKLATSGAGIVPNQSVFPVVLEGPIYGPCNGTTCTIAVTLAIGQDPTKAVTSKQTIATVNFNPVAPTTTGPTQVAFGTAAQVLSLSSTDQPSENVLSTTSPVSITIAGSAIVSPTPISTITPTPTSIPSNNLTPTPTGSSSASCTSFTASPNSGTSPLATLFTAVGSDTNASITKVTFNFGDGTVQDVTSGGGIGTTSVNAQIAHTYSTSGTFTASATLTDTNGVVSNPNVCSQTVTVASGSTQATASATPTQIAAAPTKIPATGPGNTILTVGAIGVVLSVVGGLFFFLL